MLSVVLGLVRAILDPVVQRVASAEQPETFVVVLLASLSTAIRVILCKCYLKLGNHRKYLVSSKSSYCSNGHEADIETSFGPRGSSTEGISRPQLGNVPYGMSLHQI